jgi:transcriptional regulator with GAF, ATPase, and Fis domain
MATAGLIGCSPESGSLPGSFDQERLDLGEIVGSSGAICRVTAQVLRVALSDATVPITGEGRTGKEMLARAIHRRSNRLRLPFVCSALLLMETG